MTGELVDPRTCASVSSSCAQEVVAPTCSYVSILFHFCLLLWQPGCSGVRTVEAAAAGHASAQAQAKEDRRNTIVSAVAEAVAKPDPIDGVLEIDRTFYPDANIEKARHAFGSLRAKTIGLLGASPDGIAREDGAKLVRAALRVLRDEGFRTVDIEVQPDSWIEHPGVVSAALCTKRSNCLSLTILALCIAAALGGDVSTVCVAEHAFLRAPEHGRAVDIESTRLGGSVDATLADMASKRLPKGTVLQRQELSVKQTLWHYSLAVVPGTRGAKSRWTQKADTLLVMNMEVLELIAKVREELGSSCLMLDRHEASALFDTVLFTAQVVLNQGNPYFREHPDVIRYGRRAEERIRALMLGHPVDPNLHWVSCLLYGVLDLEARCLELLTDYLARVPEALSSEVDLWVRVEWWTRRAVTNLDKYRLVTDSERSEALSFLTKYQSSQWFPPRSKRAVEALRGSR